LEIHKAKQNKNAASKNQNKTRTQGNMMNETVLDVVDDVLSSMNETVIEQNNTTNGTNPENSLFDLIQKVYNTPTAIISYISIILNCLVIATFVRERKGEFRDQGDKVKKQ
jgi:hypothetical protein